MGRSIQAYLLIGLSVAMVSGSASAETSSLQALSMDKNGAIQLEVQGEGFDPMLRLQKEAGGVYRIIIEGRPLTLGHQAKQSLTVFRSAILRQYPAIAQVELQQTGPMVRLILTSRQKMQPQVLSNTGSRIALTLIKAGKGHSAEETASRSSSLSAEASGKAMDSVELDLDGQLALRQKQAEARREVIKAQELAWQAKPESSPEVFSQLASATASEAKLTRPPAFSPASPLAQSPPLTNAIPRETSPLRLSAPPNAGSEASYDAQTLYRARASISGDSLYGLKQDPQVNAKVREAIRQALQGQHVQAVSALQSFLKAHPDEVSAQVALAMILLNSSPTAAEERRQAAELLHGMLKKAPYLPAYELLIRLALDENRLPDAESLLEKAELLNASHPMLLFLKGRLLEAKSRLEEAKAAYQRTLEQAPYFGEAHYRLAQIALKSGKLDAARWELLQTLQQSPEDSRALKLLAYVAQRQGQTEQALTLYSKTLQPDAMLNLARLLAGQKQISKAQGILQAVEALAEDNPALLFNVGMLYAELHQPKRARQTLNRFIQLQKDSTDPKLAQARETLKKLGR